MLPISLTDEEAKLNIIKSIYTFIETRISRPMEYISDKASSMIQQDDVILTYAKYLPHKKLFQLIINSSN